MYCISLVACASQGNIIKFDMHTFPLLNNKMQTDYDGWYNMKYRTTHVGREHFVCSITLIETFIFDRKAEQY